MKPAEKVAEEIVLKWGNEINWARYPQEYGYHISEEDRFRLQRAIARALRKALKNRYIGAMKRKAVGEEAKCVKVNPKYF
jgi:hypothetical protein